jgi:hypothetical protein
MSLQPVHDDSFAATNAAAISAALEDQLADSGWSFPGADLAVVQQYVTLAQQGRETIPCGAQAAPTLQSLCAALLGRIPSTGSQPLAALAKSLDQSSWCFSDDRQFAVIAADHLGRPHPAPLYRTDRNLQSSLRSRSELGDLTATMLRAVLAEQATTTVLDRLRPIVTPMLFELFRNTAEHALLDHVGNLHEYSLRIVHARRHQVSSHDVEAIQIAFPPLASFYRRLLGSADDRQTDILELSVLDSGPGIAVQSSNEQNRDHDLAEIERLRLLELARLGASTKRHRGAGVGLSTVFAIGRDADAFVRLRSGRLSLGADLGSAASLKFGEVPDLVPMGTGRELAPVSGTLWSLLIPVLAQD